MTKEKQEEQQEDKQIYVKMETVKNYSIGLIRGQDHITDRLNKIRLSINNIQMYYSLGGKLPKGILFVGDSGVGKTASVRAIVSDLDVKLAYIKSGDVISTYVDGRAKNLKPMLDKISHTAKTTPVLVVIDELEFLIPDRKNTNAREGTSSAVSLLLEWMDGLEENNNIIVIGCTNLVEKIDPAAMRSGRFTEKLFFNKLNAEAICQIMCDHIKESNSASKVALFKTPHKRDKKNITKRIKQLIQRYSVNGADAKESVIRTANEAIIGFISKNMDLKDVYDEMLDRKNLLTLKDAYDSLVEIVSNNSDTIKKKNILDKVEPLI